MHPDRELERHREFISSIVMLMSACQKTSIIEDQNASLKAACECALSSLDNDLRVIAEIDEYFSRNHGAR